MASIFELKTAKGGTSWRAQVCILTKDNRRGRVSKVFSNRKLAEAWVKKKEQESRTVGVALPSKATCKSVGDLIQAYIDDNSDTIGKTALSCLRILKDIRQTRRIATMIFERPQKPYYSLPILFSCSRRFTDGRDFFLGE